MKRAVVACGGRATRALAAMALVLGGCAMGPDFHAPVAPTADRYTATPVSGTGPGEVRLDFAPAGMPERWWTVYGSRQLDAWVAEGLANNRDLQATVATLEEARQHLQARVGETELPSAGAELQASRQRALGLPFFGPPTSVYQLFAGVVQVDYTLDLFGGVRRANEAARADVDVQAQEWAAARQSLAANIVIAAIGSAALRSQVETQQRIVALARRRADLVQRRFELGSAASSAVRAARQQQHAQAQALPGLQAQWERARDELAILLGRAPQDAPADLDFAALQLPSQAPVTVPSALVRTRPDILAAEAALHAATARVGVATANLFPQINLTASYGSESFRRASFLHSPTTVWGASGTLLQPLFEGGALRAERGAAAAGLDAATRRYENTVLRAFGNVGDALITLQADARALAEQTAAQAEAQRLYAETVRRHDTGAANLPDVLASEQARLEEELATTAGTRAQLVDTAGLFQAVGAPVR
jgi:NodT family efflux transporter outer membrane factor (OMF) lipoprotein